MRLFLEPTEPLLFRTGRPFDAGESGFAETLFPPTPETMQGAVRAAIATCWDTSKSLEEVFQDEGLTNLIGSRGAGYGRFRMTGLSLGRRKGEGTVERLFPAPAHLLTVTEKQKKDYLLLKPQKMGYPKCSDLAENAYYLFPEKALETEGKREPFEDWLTESGLEKVLRSNLQFAEDEIVPERKILSREFRLGIGMDNTSKTTREGHLYQTQVIRLQPGYGFVVDLRLRDPAKQQDTSYFDSFIDDIQTQRTLNLPNSGWIMLGGERRTARFEVVPNPTTAIEKKKRGKLLYLATPAALNGGWLPGALSASPITAAIDRYKPIGGWELDPASSGGSSKTTRRCVPAGSIYFFEDAIDVTQPLTDYGMEIGYGIAYAGE